MASSMDHDVLGLGDKNQDKFKPVFKYFKQRKPPPDLSEVIDFNLVSCKKHVRQLVLSECGEEPPLSLSSPKNWKIFTLENIPGLTFIRNPFLDGTHWYWIRRCLQDYTMKPNIMNIDAHVTMDSDVNIWNHAIIERSQLPLDKTLLWKLRWTTLGYHHDWNTKKYSAENFTSVPDDLQTLSKFIATQIGWSKYNTEAVIVNYYHNDSTLAGHTDHSELDHSAPLISVSFGQTALFMIGGTTKATKPVTMYLRSGDIVIMEGPARLAYHAVPKIFTGTCDFSTSLWKLPEKWLSKGADHDFDAELCKEYLSMSRINLNMRQVHPADTQVVSS